MLHFLGELWQQTDLCCARHRALPGGAGAACLGDYQPGKHTHTHTFSMNDVKYVDSEKLLVMGQWNVNLKLQKLSCRNEKIWFPLQFLILLPLQS